MKNKLFMVCSIIIFCFVIYSCSDDDDEIVLEDRITYERDILPLFRSKEASCARSSGCHSLNSVYGTTETYEGAKKMAESGRLIGALEWRTGYVPMPNLSRPLSEGQINLVIGWINDGILEK